MLVKRHEESRVPVAEDVAAFAAVVPAGEVAERALAGRIIADRGFDIGLEERVLVTMCAKPGVWRGV